VNIDLNATVQVAGHQGMHQVDMAHMSLDTLNLILLNKCFSLLAHSDTQQLDSQHSKAVDEAI
jgi:hypothetical protein